MADQLAKLFSAQIKKLRKDGNDTPETLAAKLTAAGAVTTEEEVRSWEKARGIPGRDTLAALCKLYECELYRLFGLKSEEEFHNLTLSANISSEEALALQFTPVNLF